MLACYVLLNNAAVVALLRSKIRSIQIALACIPQHLKIEMVTWNSSVWLRLVTQQMPGRSSFTCPFLLDHYKSLFRIALLQSVCTFSISAKGSVTHRHRPDAKQDCAGRNSIAIVRLFHGNDCIGAQSQCLLVTTPIKNKC